MDIEVKNFISNHEYNGKSFMINLRSGRTFAEVTILDDHKQVYGFISKLGDAEKEAKEYIDKNNI